MLPNDEASLRSVAAGIDPSTARRTLAAVHHGGAVVTGAQAVFTTVSRTGGLTGLVARPLSARPVSLLFEPGYRLFSRHRGRFARFFRDPE